METEIIYFLVFVAVCAVSLLVLVWKLEKKHKAKLKTRKAKARKRALQQRRREPGRHRLFPGPTAPLTDDSLGERAKRIQPAGELKDGSTIAASGLFPDEAEVDERSATWFTKR